MLSIGVLGFIVWAFKWARNFAICWNRLMNSIVYIVLLFLNLNLNLNLNKVDGIFGKLELLSNQQEIEKSSSETYTQSSSITKTISGAKLTFPEHIKSYDPDFLNWFIGFTEGDGSFVIWEKTNKIGFSITQKDPKVLYHIKKKLGFGKVYVCKDTYYRYIVSNRENLEHLINIFNQTNGLRLLNTYNKFIQWSKSYSIYYSIPQIDIIPQQAKITLNEAWLSGFIDAEGCFDAPQRHGRTTFRMRFSLKQKSEYETFKQFPILWGDKKIYLLKNKDIVILTMDSLKSLKFLISYLNKYPLKSIKNIAYNKWLKLYRVIEEGGRGKSYEEIKLMAQNINKYEDEDKVQ